MHDTDLRLALLHDGELSEQTDIGASQRLKTPADLLSAMFLKPPHLM